MRYSFAVLTGFVALALLGGRAARAAASVPARPAVIVASVPARPSPVSFQPTSWGAPIVPVLVNGRIAAHFLLDTSYATTFVSPDLAARLGLKEHPIAMGGRTGSAVTLDRLQIGGAALRETDLDAPVTELSALSQVSGAIVDGILGADALATSAVAIDFPRSRITVWSHGGLSAEELKQAGFDGACMAPLGGVPYTVAATVNNGGQSRTVDLVVGTGAPFDIVPRADLVAAGGSFLPLWDQPDLPVARVSSLCVGTASVTAPLLRIASGDDRPTLGLRTLLRFRMLLDAPGGKLYLVPAVTIAPPPPGASVLRVPFKFGVSTSHFMIVQASIDGHAPLPFILDTGVTLPLVLDPAAARKLGIAQDGTRAPKVNGVLPATSGAISSLRLPGLTERDTVKISLEQATIRDLGPLRHILPHAPLAGIIGAGVLRDTALKIDFAARVLTFYPGSSPVAPAGAAELPFAAAAHPDSYFVSLAPSSGRNVTLSVDTGSWNTMAPQAAVAGWQPKAVCGSGGWAFGALTLGENFWMPRFALGSAVASDVDVTVAPIDAAMPWLPGILGLNALSQFTVTLDIPNSRLLILPPSGRRAVSGYRTGWTGMFLKTAGNGVCVREVVPKSPAADAGVRAGDTILAIDGRPVVGQGLFAVRDLVLGQAGTMASLRLRAADGKPFSVRLQRLSQYDAPRGPLFGLFCHQRGAAPLQVDGVEDSSPAGRAGIRKGDTIVAIDGHRLSTLTADQFFEVSPRRVTLTVRPGGDGKPRGVSLDAPARTETARPFPGVAALNSRKVTQPAN